MKTFFLPYVSDHAQLWRICLTIILSTFFILYFFQPFGDIQHGFTLDGFLRVLSYSVVASGTVYLAELLLGPVYRSRIGISQTRYGSLIWYFFVLFLVVFGIFCCRSSWLGWSNTTVDDLFRVLYRVSTIAIIPFCLMALILMLYHKKEADQTLTLTSDDTNPEHIQVELGHLLYLASEENYTSIFLVSDRKVNKKLLRGSLSHFEKQLKVPIVRIHRSHLINITKIEKVKMNNSGGSISLKSVDTQFSISRKYITHFQNHWARLH